MVVDHLLRPRLDRGPVGHVEALRGDLDAAALAQAHGLGQADLVDVGERQVRATPGQVGGEGPADARAGSGDGGHTAVEVLHGDGLLQLAAGTATRAWWAGFEKTITSSSMSLFFRAR